MSSRSHPYQDEGGYRDRGDLAAKDMTHEMRREREKPTRTLFVRNVPYEATQDELTNLFTPFGRLSRFYNLISTRGMAFVTYYDLRHADRAKRALQGHAIAGRAINIHYSLPRDGDTPSVDSKISEDVAALQNMGSLFVLCKDVTESVTNQDIQELFTQWGEVKEVRDGRGKNFTTKFIDFWDTRDAVKAVEAANGLPWRNGTLEVRFAFPTPVKTDRPGPARRDGRYDDHPPSYQSDYYDDHRSRDYPAPSSSGYPYDPYSRNPDPYSRPPPPAHDPYARPPESSYPYGGSLPAGYSHPQAPSAYPYSQGGPPSGHSYQVPPPPPASTYVPHGGPNYDDQTILHQINQWTNMLNKNPTQLPPGGPSPVPSAPNSAYPSHPSSYPPPSSYQVPPSSQYPPNSNAPPPGQSGYPPSYSASYPHSGTY